MRFYKLWFWLVIGPLSLVSCEKDKVETPQPPEYWGEASALLDGSPVDFSVYATHVNGEPHLSILIDTLNEEGFKRGRISIHKIPIHIGNYRLFNKEKAIPENLPYSIYSASGSDGDAVLAFYDLLETDTMNFLELTSYDDTLNEVIGSFQVTFVIDSSFMDNGFSLRDTLKFTQGYFHTKIYEF